MKSKEEIANKHGILSGKDNEFDKAVLNAMEEYAVQCQEDMAKEIEDLKEQLILKDASLSELLKNYGDLLFKLNLLD